MAAGFIGLNFAGVLATTRITPPFLYYPIAMYPAHHVFAVFFFAISTYTHWLLWRARLSAEAVLRNQIQYVFWGSAIGFLGGWTTFPLSFDVHVFPIGAY